MYDNPFEIVCRGDRAEAETAEEALVAADRLVTDHLDANPGASLKRTRAAVYIAENGTYNGTLTNLARNGYRVLLSTEWSRAS